LAIPSQDNASYSEMSTMDLGPTVGLVLGGLALLFYFVCFVVPIVVLTVLAILARRDGPAARAAAGVLGLLGAVCAARFAVVGLSRTFAGAFAIGVLLVLGLGLMAVSILSRAARSDPAAAPGDVAAAPFKRMLPWSAVAAGLGAVLVFASSVRQSRIDARADARTGMPAPLLSVDMTEQPHAPRDRGRARLR
jgi:hypothetical protein